MYLDWLPQKRSKGLFERATINIPYEQILTKSCVQSIKKQVPSDSFEIQSMIKQIKTPMKHNFCNNETPKLEGQFENEELDSISISRISIDSTLKPLIFNNNAIEEENENESEEDVLIKRYFQLFENKFYIKAFKKINNSLNLKICLFDDQQIEFRLKDGYKLKFQLLNRIDGVTCKSQSKMLIVQYNTVSEIRRYGCIHYKGNKQAKLLFQIE